MKRRWRPDALAALAAALALAAFAGPLSPGRGALEHAPAALLLALAALALALVGAAWSSALTVPLGLAGALLAIRALEAAPGVAAWGFWALFWGLLLASVLAVGRLSLLEPAPDEPALLARLRRFMPPATVPLVLLLAWQALVSGFGVPKGIFPSVVNVYGQLGSSFGVLMNDSYVTFVFEVLLGFAIGVAAGFATGVAVAYSRFLQRGFLPLAAAFGAVPIVGLAPVLGRAFGVDWQSKAAVVVIVTFFPVVLNTVEGLVRVDPVKLELLRAYAANPRQVFFKLRLPSALPYLFNALKLAAVLSVISVIVAEFLIPGPPKGLGQRISLSARQGAYDVAFAAIFVSSLVSVAIYGLFSWLERRLTGWHPSFREE